MTIDLTKAIEVSAKAAYCEDIAPEFCDHMWGTADIETTNTYYREARAALTAALPHIEKQVREQIAAEIEEALRQYRADHTPPTQGAVAFAAGMQHTTTHIRNPKETPDA